MTDTVVKVLIVLGVLALLGTITKLIANLFTSKRKLEKQLDESMKKTNDFEKSTEAEINKIRNTLMKTDDVYYETVKAMRERIYELTETLSDTYQVTCNLYDEYKILMEYAMICRKIDADGLSKDLEKQLKHTIEKHNEFLNELNQKEQEQDISISEQSQGFEVTQQWE